MVTYKPGDIVWRRGTVGAGRDPVDHPVLILAANNNETIGGQILYTCAPITSEPAARSGSVALLAGGGKQKYANLSRMLIAGGGTFISPPGQGKPLLGRLDDTELSSLKTSVDAIMAVSGNHLGKILYSATPSHDGVRGKTHRPYALIGEVGRGSGFFVAAPVSSSPGPCSSGDEILDLKSAGLVRDEGEASYTRLAWTAAISVRTASKEAGRLGEGDRQNLYRKFLTFKRDVLSGIDAEMERRKGEEKGEHLIISKPPNFTLGGSSQLRSRAKTPLP